MPQPMQTTFDDDELTGSTPRSKGHRTSRWRRRFFILAVIAIVSNLTLLILLAYSYYNDSRAFSVTKDDLRVALQLLPGQLTRDELRESMLRLDRSVEVKEAADSMQIAGLIFHFDKNGKVERVEHWTASAKLPE